MDAPHLSSPVDFKAIHKEWGLVAAEVLSLSSIQQLEGFMGCLLNIWDFFFLILNTVYETMIKKKHAVTWSDTTKSGYESGSTLL